jgi:hypothetical protein
MRATDTPPILNETGVAKLSEPGTGGRGPDANTVGKTWRPRSTYGKALLLLFLLSLPLANPWVRGDGVGYYAYARALVINRDLRFEQDWRFSNPSFRADRVDTNGRIRDNQYTSTGYLCNTFAIGAAILWIPFLAVTHMSVLAYNGLGGRVAADGFSLPYTLTMALATALYGFIGLYLAFCMAREYVEERWAFLATVGIWFSSSLIVYMYFNPSWSHAHSTFAVGLFIWYWHRTRGARTPAQWVVLGLVSGLMVNVYYVNGILLLLPLMESLEGYWRAWRLPGHGWTRIQYLFTLNALYLIVFVIAMLPTLITHLIIYGGLLKSDYPPLSTWYWTSPALWSVLFSSDHGLLAWTPILIPAAAGLILLRRYDKSLATYLGLTALAFYLVIASRPGWDGLSSFGNRFFVSLTPIFVLGLSATFDALGRLWKNRRAASACFCGATALLIFWNLGFVFQWGTLMIPVRGPISWRDMAYNQFAVVPFRVSDSLKSYLTKRKELMRHIEGEDIRQSESQKPKEK